MKMFPGKAAALFLLLAVFAAVCGPVNGRRVCTEQQKKDLLLTCKLDIKRHKNGNPPPPPPDRGPCCQLVRLLRGMHPDMIRCIVGHLTKEEEEEYSTLKILELKDKCR